MTNEEIRQIHIERQLLLEKEIAKMVLNSRSFILDQIKKTDIPTIKKSTQEPEAHDIDYLFEQMDKTAKLIQARQEREKHYYKKLIDTLTDQDMDSFVTSFLEWHNKPAWGKIKSNSQYKKIDTDIQLFMNAIMDSNDFSIELVTDYFLATGKINGKDLLACNFEKYKTSDPYGMNHYLFSQGYFLSEHEFNHYFFEEKAGKNATLQTLEQIEHQQALFMAEQQRMLDRKKLKDTLQTDLNDKQVSRKQNKL